MSPLKPFAEIEEEKKKEQPNLSVSLGRGIK